MKIVKIFILFIIFLVISFAACEFNFEDSVSTRTIDTSGCAKWALYNNASEFSWSQLSYSGNFHLITKYNADTSETTELWYQSQFIFSHTYKLYIRRTLYGSSFLRMTSHVVGEKQYYLIYWSSAVAECGDRAFLNNKDFVLVVDGLSKEVISIIQGDVQDKVFHLPKAMGTSLLINCYEHCHTNPNFKKIIEYTFSPISLNFFNVKDTRLCP